MGAAWDAMCENEDLEAMLKQRNRKIREQKKIIIELAEGILKLHYAEENFSTSEVNAFYDRAEKILTKLNKKKKK